MEFDKIQPFIDFEEEVHLVSIIALIEDNMSSL